LATLLATSCATTRPNTAQEPNPCIDPVYLALKERPVDELTPREYERLRDLDRACAEYQHIRERQRVLRDQSAFQRFAFWTLLGLAAIATAIGASI
ncbi:hypothetical protein, partial [Sphaerobacter thermophilus]|uniref:hypothetical protein n=1 Tax=Sphaerobacter thermophilus TaxID=2057 RepID=UPI0039C2C312